MPSYTKLFNSIITSTIWTEDDKTRILWITMLAIADQHGEVHASIPGLARIAGISIEDCEKGIEKFLSPDAYSRTPDFDGRRIAKINGGWELLNHAKYRKMASKEDAKEATAQRVRRHRERNADVTLSNADVTAKWDIAEAEAEEEAEENIPPNPLKGGLGGDASKKSKKSTNIPTSPQAIQLAQLYNRRLTTAWSDREIRAFKALGQIEQADLDMVCRYTKSEMDKKDNGKHRRDLQTFLNNYHGEVDRARQQQANKPQEKKPIVWLD